MTHAITSQVAELATEVTDSLKKLTALIENRSAWIDGIEGCREAAALLGHTREALEIICESVSKLEADLASARAESEKWAAMYAELSTVERDLRAESESRRLALEHRIAGVSRALVQELSRELI